jgi:hypothetical protein
MVNEVTQTDVKERPIIFSAPMVRAILEGRKTMTRRIVKPQPASGKMTMLYQDRPERHYDAMEVGGGENSRFYRCPYGRVGERLWVRETCLRSGNEYMYSDDADYDICWPTKGDRVSHWDIVPSIYMPRIASRLTLEITAVKLERLQDISPRDVASEGLMCGGFEGTISYALNCERVFAELWQSINGKDSWAANPWVWCVSFKRVQA